MPPASQLLPWATHAARLLLLCPTSPALAANLALLRTTLPSLAPELDLDGSWAGDAANKGGSGWAPFNHQRDGKALLGQLDVAFLGAYACERGVGKKGTLPPDCVPIVQHPVTSICGRCKSVQRLLLLPISLPPAQRPMRPPPPPQSACSSAGTWATAWTCATSSQVSAWH